MPTPITFTITTVGRAAALDAFTNGLTIALTEIAIGDDSYTPTGSETALSNELDRFNLSGGTVEALSATLRFSAAITALARTEVYEIGLFSSTGVLFAVASTTSTTVPLVVAEANIDTICAFGMVLGDVPASSLTITLDPNAPLAIQLMNQHVGAENPHPQYAMSADLLAEIDARTAEILALNNAVDTLSSDLIDEVVTREAADMDLTSAINEKAALAGSSSQVFNAADGVSGKNVVNVDQLDARTSVATDAQAGIVEKSLLAELVAGTADKFPDSAQLISGLAKTLNANGYMKLPSFLGGLIIQWGEGSADPADNTEPTQGISFSTIFTTVYQVYVSTSVASANDNCDMWYQTYNLSTTGFNVKRQISAAAANSVATRPRWFAIGV